MIHHQQTLAWHKIKWRGWHGLTRDNQGIYGSKTACHRSPTRKNCTAAVRTSSLRILTSKKHMPQTLQNSLWLLNERLDQKKWSPAHVSPFHLVSLHHLAPSPKEQTPHAGRRPTSCAALVEPPWTRKLTESGGLEVAQISSNSCNATGHSPACEDEPVGGAGAGYPQWHPADSAHIGEIPKEILISTQIHPNISKFQAKSWSKWEMREVLRLATTGQ